MKDKLRSLSQKSEKGPLSNIEKERQLLLNELLDKIRDSSSLTELTKTENNISKELVLFVKELVESLNNSKRGLIEQNQKSC